MSKVIFLIGPPCSGKSTFARIMMNSHSVIISRDSIRTMLHGGYYMGYEEEVTEIVDFCIDTMIKSNIAFIILDNTHCNEFLLKLQIKRLRYKFPDIELEYKLFEIDLDTFRQRNVREGKHIPEEVFIKMYNNLQKLKPKLDEIFHK